MHTPFDEQRYANHSFLIRTENAGAQKQEGRGTTILC